MHGKRPQLLGAPTSISMRTTCVDLAGFERRALARSWHRRIGRWRRLAELDRGQLSIEGDVMPRGRLIPVVGERTVAERGGAAPGPVGGPGLALRCGDCLVHAGEATECFAWLVGVAQRQPTRQPLGLSEVEPLGLAVPARQPVRQVEVPLAQQTADLQLALEPPSARVAEHARRIK